MDRNYLKNIKKELDNQDTDQKTGFGYIIFYFRYSKQLCFVIYNNKILSDNSFIIHVTIHE